MKIELWPLDKIIPYYRNPRTISQKAIDKVALSIEEFGWRQPIVVNEAGVIIVGHVRYRAARKLGLDTAPVHVAGSLSPMQVRAYRLMDNRSHEETGWDFELLALETSDLKAFDFDLRFTGFDGREIDRLLIAGDDDGAENQVPPLPDNPITKVGDLWNCPPHRLLCGDATDGANVARVLGGECPPVMITDPPYGVELDPAWREQAGLGVPRQVGKVANDDRVDWSAAHRLFPGDVAYIWHAGIHAAAVATGIESVDFEIRSQIIWAKPNFVLSRGAYHWQHEPCWYCVRKGHSARWRGDRAQSTLWQVASLNPFGGKNPEETATGHGTQKPVELMRRPILNHTEPGEAIYDPFLGSGTTLIAAELTGRVCYGLEIDPKYADLIVCRWQELTGRAATLDRDGRCFDQVKAESLAVGAL